MNRLRFTAGRCVYTGPWYVFLRPNVVEKSTPGANFRTLPFYRAFGSIPEDFGNRRESTITKVPMRNKQWQKHQKTDQTTANRRTVFLFFTDEEPRYCQGIFPTGICFWNKVVKFPWPYRGSYLVKKKTPPFDSPWFGLFLMVPLPLFIPHW